MIVIDKYIGNEKDEINLLTVIAQASQEKGDIEVMIDSMGGDLDVAISIYNYLISLPNKIITRCVNYCASAASVVFIVGDERIAECPIMIHNPYLDGVIGDKETLIQASEYIGESESQLEALYEARTNLDQKTVSDLMNIETYISPSQAVQLGFATQAKVIAHARIDKINYTKQINKTENMGFFNKDNQKRHNVTLVTDGDKTLTLEKEEGSPVVGDRVLGDNPDGTYHLPDGDTVIVEGGFITEVRRSDNEVKNEDGDINHTADEKFDYLVELMKDLSGRVEAIEKQQSESRPMTKEDAVILNKISQAGGIDKVLQELKSKYSPQGRQQQQATNNTVKSPLDEKLSKLKKDDNGK